MAFVNTKTLFCIYLGLLSVQESKAACEKGVLKINLTSCSNSTPQSSCSIESGEINSNRIEEAFKHVVSCPELIGISLSSGEFPISRSINLPRLNLIASPAAPGISLIGTEGTTLYMNQTFMKNVEAGHSGAMIRVAPTPPLSEGEYKMMTGSRSAISHIQIQNINLRMNYYSPLNPWTPTADPFGFASSKGGIGIDISNFDRANLKKISVTSDSSLPFAVGIYGRGTIKGDSPYGTVIKNFKFLGPEQPLHTVGIMMAQNLVITPGSGQPIYESMGANGNLIEGGAISNAAIGVWINGISNTITGINMKSISFAPYIFGSSITKGASLIDGLYYNWSACPSSKCPINCYKNPYDPSCNPKQISQIGVPYTQGNLVFSGVISDSRNAKFTALFLPGSSSNVVYRNSLSKIGEPLTPGLAWINPTQQKPPVSDYENSNLVADDNAASEVSALESMMNNNRVICPGLLSNESSIPLVNPQFDSLKSCK